MSRFKFVLPLLLCVLGEASVAQETVYMAVLSSRKHRLNVSDNPIVGLFVSTDAGDTWSHKGWKEYIRTFYAEAGGDGTIWSACGNGVLRSTDKGDNWRITTGWEITEVLKVKVDPENPSTVYAATAYGIFKTTDGGNSWKEKKIGLTLPFTSDVVIDQRESKRVFAATEEGVYRSEDAGETWSMSGLQGKGIRTIAQGLEGTTFWVGSEEEGVYRSTDGGRTWASMNKGLKHLTVYVVVPDPMNKSIVYLGTHGGGVYVTENSGNSWSQRMRGMENLVVHSIAVLRSNPKIVFAGTLNGGLYRSTDAGGTWKFNSQEEGQVWGLSTR